MRAQRVLGQVDADEVSALTLRAFDGQQTLIPPSGALAESAEQIRADFDAEGGILLRDDDGALVASCRVRRIGLAWVLRRCAVAPEHRRRGVGRRLIRAAEQWAVEEGAVRTHVGVREALTDNQRFWQQLGYAPLRTHAGFWTELVHPLPLRLTGPEQTQQLGIRLSRQLRPGDLLVLSGPLGAGKTALAQGIGLGLGVRGAVTSPTFVLARMHEGELPLVHVDAYRLRDTGGRLELDDLDLDAALEDSVTVVEWGEGLVEGLAQSRLDVDLQRPDEAWRTVTVRPVGPRWSVFA